MRVNGFQNEIKVSVTQLLNIKNTAIVDKNGISSISSFKIYYKLRLVFKSVKQCLCLTKG